MCLCVHNWVCARTAIALPQYVFKLVFVWRERKKLGLLWFLFYYTPHKHFRFWISFIYHSSLPHPMAMFTTFPGWKALRCLHVLGSCWKIEFVCLYKVSCAICVCLNKGFVWMYAWILVVVEGCLTCNVASVWWTVVLPGMCIYVHMCSCV